MRALFFAILAGCSDPAPQSAADCIPSTGDNCSCDPQCLTQAEIDQFDSFCDLGCYEPDWTCDLVDGACVVVAPAE